MKTVLGGTTGRRGIRRDGLYFFKDAPNSGFSPSFL
jgi:hypothetical protein